VVDDGDEDCNVTESRSHRAACAMGNQSGSGNGALERLEKFLLVIGLGVQHLG
jgi:hypothetical protein